MAALRVFKKRKEASSYHTWHEEDDSPSDTEQDATTTINVECSIEERARFLLTGTDCTDGTSSRTYLYGATGNEQSLTDCFYLGSYDMTGRNVKGQGCIDEPASFIWKQTQQCTTIKPSTTTGSHGYRRRKNSLPSSTSYNPQFKPRYIRLVAGTEDLKIVDNRTDEILISFSYRCISFTGTHHKYNRMFCFIAWEPKAKTPYCHAFKCEDITSARSTALKLSNIFKRKCQEILGQSSEITPPIVPRPVLRKSLSVQCQ